MPISPLVIISANLLVAYPSIAKLDIIIRAVKILVASFVGQISAYPTVAIVITVI